MDFIDEKHIVRLQTGQDTGQIARLVEYRSRSHLESHPQFIGNDVAQRSLSQSGRSVQQHMVQSLRPQTGRLDKDTQVVYHLVLSAEVLEL